MANSSPFARESGSSSLFNSGASFVLRVTDVPGAAGFLGASSETKSAKLLALSLSLSGSSLEDGFPLAGLDASAGPSEFRTVLDDVVN
jgi:hypothetical protein